MPAAKQKIQRTIWIYSPPDGLPMYQRGVYQSIVPGNQ